MDIDLTKPGSLTVGAIRELIASIDDSQHRQIRVSNAGRLYVSNDVGADNLDGVKFRFETATADNGYFGTRAASDDEYVKSVYATIKRCWDEGRTGFIDFLD